MIPKPACVSTHLGTLYKSRVPQISFSETVILAIGEKAWEFCSFRNPQQASLMQSPIWELSHHLETSSAIIFTYIYHLQNNVFQWEYTSNFIIVVKGNTGFTLHKVALGALYWNTSIAQIWKLPIGFCISISVLSPFSACDLVYNLGQNTFYLSPY